MIIVPRALVWLGPESAQVRVQKVMKACVRYSEYLTGLPKWRFKPNLSRHCRSSTSPITFSESWPQSGSLSPDLRVHGRPDISLPSYLLCSTFPVFSHQARCGRLPSYICPRFLLLVAAYQTVILFRRLSHTLARLASYAYLHSPRKAHSGLFCLHSPSPNTSVEEICRKVFWARPDSRENYGVHGLAVSTTSECGGSILCLDILLMRT